MSKRNLNIFLYSLTIHMHIEFCKHLAYRVKRLTLTCEVLSEQKNLNSQSIVRNLFGVGGKSILKVSLRGL